MVFSAVVSYAMYLKLHSDVTTFAEESSHKSDLELLELRATLNRLHEELRSKEAATNNLINFQNKTVTLQHSDITIRFLCADINATAHLRDEMRNARFTGTVADMREEGRGWRPTEAALILLMAFCAFLTRSHLILHMIPFFVGSMDARIKKEIRRIPGLNPVSSFYILHHTSLDCHAAATEPMGHHFRRDGRQGRL